MNLPEISLPVAAAPWPAGSLLDGPWAGARPLGPLREVTQGLPVRQQTAVRLHADADALRVRFDCEDDDIWGTHTRRDQPLYDEEVVELFLAPGAEVPRTYFEFEVSPLGVLFDARIHNPTGDRRQMRVESAWDCAGVAWEARIAPDRRSWSAALAVPWSAVGPAPRPDVWRLNLYRIERPRGAPGEFSSWSPSLAVPADFHRPARFGFLRLAAGGR